MPKYTENNPNDKLWQAYFKIKPYRAEKTLRRLWNEYKQMRAYVKYENLYLMENK